MLVTYCLLQPSATTSPFVRLPDWVCSAATLAVGAAILLQNPTTRAEIRAFPGRSRPAAGARDARRRARPNCGADRVLPESAA